MPPRSTSRATGLFPEIPRNSAELSHLERTALDSARYAQTLVISRVSAGIGRDIAEIRETIGESVDTLDATGLVAHVALGAAWARPDSRELRTDGYQAVLAHVRASRTLAARERMLARAPVEIGARASVRAIAALDLLASESRREAHDTIDVERTRTRDWLRMHGLRRGPTVVLGAPSATYVRDARDPTALASAGAIQRDLIPTSTGAIAAAIAADRADRAVARLGSDRYIPRKVRKLRKRGGKRKRRAMRASNRSRP